MGEGKGGVALEMEIGSGMRCEGDRSQDRAGDGRAGTEAKEEIAQDRRGISECSESGHKSSDWRRRTSAVFAGRGRDLGCKVGGRDGGKWLGTEGDPADERNVAGGHRTETGRSIVSSACAGYAQAPARIGSAGDACVAAGRTSGVRAGCERRAM